MAGMKDLIGDMTENDALWEQHKDDWKDAAPAWCKHCKRLDHLTSRITGDELFCYEPDTDSAHHYISSNELMTDCPRVRAMLKCEGGGCDELDVWEEDGEFYITCNTRCPWKKGKQS